MLQLQVLYANSQLPLIHSAIALFRAGKVEQLPVTAHYCVGSNEKVMNGLIEKLFFAASA